MNIKMLPSKKVNLLDLFDLTNTYVLLVNKKELLNEAYDAALITGDLVFVSMEAKRFPECCWEQQSSQQLWQYQ